MASKVWEKAASHIKRDTGLQIKKSICIKVPLLSKQAKCDLEQLVHSAINPAPDIRPLCKSYITNVVKVVSTRTKQPGTFFKNSHFNMPTDALSKVEL